MFRDNKREIFGFRKYKAYGLASAVIAAFFLMGGVASADEVTSASSSDTTAHVVTSPTEMSANNATVVSGNDVLSNNGVVENRAIEMPVAAETTQVDSVNSDAVSNNEAPAIEAAPKEIQGSAQSKVTPEGRTVTITTYKLIKTPDNEHGDVVGGEIIEVPYVYRKNVEERFVPGDAPKVEIPATNVTRYQTEDGTDIKDSETGFVDAPNTIGNYQFTGVTNTNEGGDVQTHIYAKIVTDVPGDAPQVDIPELRLTRHVNEKGDELLPIEEGSNGPRKTIGDYEYTGRTDVEGGVTTHVYAPIRYEIPGDAPQYDIPELKVTRHVDEKGKELIDTEKGIQPPRKTIGDHEYTGRTTEKDGITTHVYTPIKHEVPGDAPQYDIPELKVTRHVDEKGK